MESLVNISCKTVVFGSCDPLLWSVQRLSPFSLAVFTLDPDPLSFRSPAFSKTTTVLQSRYFPTQASSSPIPRLRMQLIMLLFKKRENWKGKQTSFQCDYILILNPFFWVVFPECYNYKIMCPNRDIFAASSWAAKRLSLLAGVHVQ